MKNSLLFQAFSKFFAGLLLCGLLLFLPAGTFSYWNGWLFIILLFVPMVIAGIVLYLKAPALLAKRLNNKEKETEQKSVILLSALIFVLAFVLAGLDFRFGWSHLPLWLVIVASIILLASYSLFAEVMRENAWLSRTVEVQDGQHVIDSGLYGIVRHPMYTATLFLYFSMPLVLGSWVSFVVLLSYPFLIAKRIRNEEEVLETGLSGYTEYKQRVRYRLVPFIW